MPTLRKLPLAASMLMEAHERYTSPRSETDLLTSIVLSGAVLGIISPLLKEQGGSTYHAQLSKLAKLLEPGEPEVRETLFQTVYNGLKHAGFEHRKLKASDDLEITADLRLEAGRMLDAASHDFREILVPANDHELLPPGFVIFLAQHLDYA